jgi:hypothetical protein
LEGGFLVVVVPGLAGVNLGVVVGGVGGRVVVFVVVGGRCGGGPGHFLVVVVPGVAGVVGVGGRVVVGGHCCGGGVVRGGLGVMHRVLKHRRRRKVGSLEHGLQTE